MEKIMKLLRFLLPSFLLAACGASSQPTPILPSGYGSPISECFPARDAVVWEDSNGDGKQDERERPLAGIPVAMYHAGTRDNANLSSGVTDAQGAITLHGIGDLGEKCDELDIAVDVPSDYLPTTPTTVSLIGQPYDYIARFGLISQFPTPKAKAGGSFADPGTLAPPGEFFQACSLIETENLSPYLGTSLDFPLTSSGAIGENGVMTYDCMTAPSETAVTFYYALAVESDSARAAAFFDELIAPHPDASIPDSLGDDARFWQDENGVMLYAVVLQGNVVLNLNLAFWLDDSPETHTRVIEFARLILTRLFERGG